MGIYRETPPMGLPCQKHSRSSKIFYEHKNTHLSPLQGQLTGIHIVTDSLTFLSTIPKHINYTIKNIDDPTCDHSPVILQITIQIVLNPPRPLVANGSVNWNQFFCRSWKLNKFENLTEIQWPNRGGPPKFHNLYTNRHLQFII